MLEAAFQFRYYLTRATYARTHMQCDLRKRYRLRARARAWGKSMAKAWIKTRTRDRIITQQYHDKLMLRRGVCTHASYARKLGST